MPPAPEDSDSEDELAWLSEKVLRRQIRM